MINKQTIGKLVAMLILLGAFIEKNLDLLKGLGLPENVIDWIKLLGLLTAAFLPSVTAKQKIVGDRPKDNGGR